MIYVHNNGVGVAGIFPFSVAETKVAEVTAAAQKAKFPLMCTLEPETGGEDAGGDDASS
jgi:ATP-dependent Clp protease adaptor protein ClpS